ncbi:hypothetical protein KA183_20765 [bacterium]|nr:hypothetical protein [bacterium]
MGIKTWQKSLNEWIDQWGKVTTETPKVKCVLEKFVQIHLPQSEMQCPLNDGNKIILSFPVETGKYRQVTYGGEQLKIPEKESKLYQFDPLKLELTPLTRTSVSDKTLDPVAKQSEGEFTHLDSKGRKWEVLCGQHFLKLKCFNKGKIVFESKASWNRKLNNTNSRPLNEALDRANMLYSYDFENWPFPPTIFLKIVFDRKENPILLTQDQGLFRFENGHWKWMFYTPELQLDEISSISVLPDNRICLVTHPTLPGSDYKRITRRNGIVIFDPAKNEYQIVRINLTAKKYPSNGS